MPEKFCSRNVMEPHQKHGYVFVDNRLYVQGIGFSGAPYVVVVKDLVVTCCEYYNEL